MNAETLIEQIQDLLKAKAIQKYEIFVAQSDMVRAEAKEGQVQSLDRASESGISIRLLLDGAMGFAYGRAAHPDLIEAAIISARHQFKDVHNHIPRTYDTYQTVDVFDARVADAGPDDCITRAITLESSARDADSRIQQVRKATFARGIGAIHIVNSNGIAVSQRATSCSASIMVMAKEQDEMQSGYEYDFSHAWEGVDVQLIGRSATHKAVNMLGARQIRTMRIPIIFDNACTADMLEIIGDAFLGENVLKGKSFLKDKLGSACFSPCLTLIDNPLDAKAADASGFDGEGVPSRKNTLVEKGVVSAFVYDSYWGKAAGKSSTGNAVRGGYRSMPGLGLRHLCLLPGENLLGTLHGLGQVLKITDIMGLHTADPISGEFSVGVNGFLIEGETVLYPVREAALAGNIHDMFARVLTVGNDVRAFGQVMSPSILVDRMDISSK